MLILETADTQGEKKQYQKWKEKSWQMTIPPGRAATKQVQKTAWRSLKSKVLAFRTD